MKRIPISSYAQFHVMFIGYNIRLKESGRTIEKFIAWQRYRELCLRMLISGKCSNKFELIDREGWRNGERIKRRKRKK